MTTPPQISPDGNWRWNGQQWIPNRPTPTPPRKQPWWPWLALGVAVFVLITISIGAAASSGGAAQKQSTVPSPKAAAATPNAALKPTAKPHGAPQPQAVPFSASHDGVTVHVSEVRYAANPPNEFAQPEAGNVFVSMDVTITNLGDKEYNANPLTFVLKDGAGIKHTTAYWDPGAIWSAVNLTKGASITKPIAFEATAGKPGGLVLVWTPTFLSGDQNIQLS